MKKNETKLALRAYRQVRNVVMQDEEGKPVFEVQLREMTAKARDEYLDEISKRFEKNSKGEMIGINKFEGMHSALLHRAMFKKKDNGEFEPIPAETIEGWPSSTTATLFEAAQELNQLNRETEGEPEKKD